MEEIESSINNRTQSILAELRGITNIKFGEYWNVGLSSPQKAHILTSLVRTVWYTNEGREITLTYISTLIDKAFCLIEDINYELKKSQISQSKKYIDLIKNLKITILNSQNGIINLKGVYHKDEKIKSDIDALIKNIKDRYNEIQDSQFGTEIHIPYQSPIKCSEPIPIKPVIICNNNDNDNPFKTPE